MTDIEILCAAIDARDDTAILALADALEEAGDARAAGLRAACAWPRPTKVMFVPGYGWWLAAEPRRNWANELPLREFSRLVGYDEGASSYERRLYPTRSAAILALAAALSEAAG